MAEENEIDLKNFTLEDKATHQSWKIRIKGYEECIKYFSTAPESQYSEFGKYENFMKTFCTDSNAVAVDKALEAVLSYIRNYPISTRTVADIAEGIISKSLSAPKKTTQDKATAVLLMCCEIDCFEPVQEKLLKGFSHKNPKVVSGCVHVLTLAMREFDQKAVNVEIILKSAKPLFEHRDKMVRDVVKKMIIQMYSRVGESLLSKLTTLKPLILQDLEVEFKKVETEKDQLEKSVQKYTKEKSEMLKPAAEKVVSEDVVIPAKATEPEDCTTEVKILQKLPPDFYEKIESKKWQDRKESLEILLSLSKNPKLASDDYYDLIMALKRVVGKDTNVLLVALAGNCLAGIAKGLHKKFSSYAADCLKTILGKFKEKKQNVVISLRNAADAVYQTTNIDSMRESVLPFLTDKNPNVKQETASFIARCFCYCTPKMLSRKILRFYAPQLLKILNNSVPIVRDSVAEALGTALKVVGDAAMAQFLDDLDAIKLQKIEEFSGKAIIFVKPSSLQAKATKDRKDSEFLLKETTTEKSDEYNVNKKQHSETETKHTNQASGLARSNSGQGRAKKTSIGSKKSISATGMMKENERTPLLQGNVMKQVRIKDEERSRSIRWQCAIPQEKLIAQLQNQMLSAKVNAELVTNMFHSDYTFRLKCIDVLNKDLTSNILACVANLDLILRWLTVCFVDSESSVVSKSMDYLTEVLTRLSDISYMLLDYEAHSFLPYLILMFGDRKSSVRESALHIMSLVCNIYPSSKLSPCIIDGLKSENPLQKTVCLEAFGSLIVGSAICQSTIDSPLKDVAKLIGHKDDAVRTAALNVLFKVYMKEKEELYKYIGKLPDEDVAILQESIKKRTENKERVADLPISPRRPIADLPISPPRQFSKPLATTEIATIMQSPIKFPTIPSRPNVILPSGNTECLKSNYSSLSKILLQNQYLETSKDIGRTATKEEKSIAVSVYNDDIALLRAEITSPSGNTECIKSEIQPNYCFSDKIMKESQCQGNSKEGGNAATIVVSSSIEISPVRTLITSPSDGTKCSTSNYSTLMQHQNKENSKEIATSTEKEEAIAESSECKEEISARNEDPSSVELTVIDRENISANTSQMFNRGYKEMDMVLTQWEESIRLRKTEKYLTEIDRLLNAITRQYKASLDSHEIDSSMQIIHRLTSFLISIFQDKEIATGISRDSLYGVIHSVLSIIVKSRLCQLDGGIGIIRELNNLVIMMIQNADYTNVFSALLKLLHNGVENEPSGKYTELAMKCTWKAIRPMSSRRAELKVGQIFFDINEFMMAFPSHTWSDKSLNKPLRTMKTVLHDLVEIYGNTLLQYVHSIPNYKGSEIEKYIIKSIKAQKEAEVSEVSKFPSSLNEFGKKLSVNNVDCKAKKSLFKQVKSSDLDERKQEITEMDVQSNKQKENIIPKGTKL